MQQPKGTAMDATAIHSPGPSTVQTTARDVQRVQT